MLKIITPSPTAFAARRPALFGPPQRRLRVCWAIAAASFVVYILGNLVHGPVGLALAALGASACGWAWLLSRALFDAAEREARWPIAVVLIVLASGAGSRLLTGDGQTAAAVDNLYGLVGSTALLLTFIEPLHGWRKDLPTPEKRFRIAFLAVYGLLVAASILLLHSMPGDADASARVTAIKNACALAGLLTGGAAVWRRLRHPLPLRTRARTSTVEDAVLARRIDRLLREDELFATPDLKVGDLARRLGEPEYRITRCITSVLGFANFNRLINHHRITRARHMLTASEHCADSILTIAYECGFASIGPFNRAFKDEVGMTPRAFRAAAAP